MHILHKLLNAVSVDSPVLDASSNAVSVVFCAVWFVFCGKIPIWDGEAGFFRGPLPSF